MIPSSLTASRGFVLRKVGGTLNACRLLVTSTGHRVRHPGLLATVGAFVLMLLPLLAVLAFAAVSFVHPVLGLTGVSKAMPGLLTAKVLREERASMAEKANQILKDAGEAKSLSAEKQAEFDAIHADVEKIGKQIESVEKHERTMAELQKPIKLVAGKADSVVEGDEAAEARKAHDAAFESFIRFGENGLTPEERTIMSGRFTRDGVIPINGGERRTAQTVTTSGGGYLIPQGFGEGLEKSMKAFGNVEEACTAFATETGNTLPWPTVDDTSNTGRLLAINTAATETALAFGVITFAAYKFSSDMVTVPVELLQDSAFSIDENVTSLLAERLGRVHNTYQTTGTGSSQPQGIVAGASSGVTAAGTTTITYDELLDLEHSIDPAYRTPALGTGYMFNDGSFKKIRQLKDGDGRPLFQPGIALGAPNTINGWQYVINQDMAAMTTGLKPVLFGALKKFRIRNVKEKTFLRLAERYAELHQVAFLAFTRMDSHVMDAGTDPLKYITMG